MAPMSVWPEGKLYTRNDWTTWLLSNEPYPYLVEKLLTCPVCLSAHFAFWTAIALQLIFPICWWVPFISFMAIPFPANYLYNRLIPHE